MKMAVNLNDHSSVQVLLLLFTHAAQFCSTSVTVCYRYLYSSPLSVYDQNQEVNKWCKSATIIREYPLTGNTLFDNSNMTHNDFMLQAFQEAFSGVRNNKGGPFGAVIVSKGNVISRGCNSVTSSNDPTAHAEIVAIRNACSALNTFELPDAVLYTTCEPCPMCMAAVYWAKIKTIYYCSDRNDAANIGFDDKFIYEELNNPPAKRAGTNLLKLDLPQAGDLMKEWINKEDKTSY
jgi:guanine deaminase